VTPVLPQAKDERSGPRIGRYLITGRIGKGGMGMVYRGLDEKLEREVAVKTLVAEGSFDPESRKRFEVEAKAAARLAHPNIVTVHELGEDRGILYIAMEMLPGADLDSLLKSGETLTLAEKLDVVAQVCRGLAFAHERGIVHRDIKPSNVRLLDDGTAKIMDFGIAKLGSGHHITKTGMMVGTVHYMSPEQVRGKPTDGRSDVFSAGVILYELLAGERPFRGEDVTQILYKIVNEEPATPELQAPAELAPRLQQVLKRALAKDPAERYASAAAFGQEIAACLEVARQGLGAAEAGSADGLAAARRALGDGHAEEAIARLRGLLASNPESLEVRRTLRSAVREEGRRQAPRAASAELYPELEATFQAAATRRAGSGDQATLAGQAGTELMPTVVATSRGEAAAAPLAPAVASAAPSRLAWLWAVGALLVLVAVASAFLRRGPAPAAAPSASPPAAAAAPRVSVRSSPPGAAVLVDGRDTGVVTDGEVVLPAPAPARVTLTFRRAGYADATRSVELPLPAGEAVSVALQATSHTLRLRTQPPGAAVALDGAPVVGTTPLELALDPAAEHRIALSLEGHAPQELRTRAGSPPATLDVTLEKLVPPGTVAVEAAYPVDVLWRGRVLAKDATSPRVQLTGGRQQLTLQAAAVFLKAELGVEVPPGGEVTLQAPGLGKLNVRATPDNCEVLVDEAFLDYPPIRDKPVAAGRHTVSFKWPDGKRSDKTVEVKAGAPAFVDGRKE
jgi:serine/threonine-protein kinase